MSSIKDIMRRENPRTASHKELLAVVQRIYDLTGQPDLRDMIGRAHEALGYVPGAASVNHDKPTLHLNI